MAAKTTMSFEMLKPGINRKEVLDLQKTVNACFCEFSGSATDAPFLEFSDEGMEAKAKLLKSFSEKAKQKGLKDAIKTAFELEDRKTLNPRLVKSALAVFLTHNKEARRLGVIVPPLALQATFKHARIAKPKPYPVTPDTLSGPGITAYFREDYDLNDHHYHWHQVFPTVGDGEGNRIIQRQGELFLYMHSQMLARYDTELYAWGLEPTHSFSYHDILPFGYTPPPGLQDEYSSRPANQGWYENNNPLIPGNTRPSIDDMINWRDNLLRDIARGKLRTVNSTGTIGEYPLTEANSMNTVGFVVEALRADLQEVSEGVKTDHEEYGSLHNNGHNKFAEVGYDPLRKLTGVMGEVEAAVRDHVFWLWHRHIDDFRRTIGNKYTHDLRTFKPDAEILQLEILPRNTDSQTPTGGIATYLTPPNTDRNEVNAKLRHEPYEWKITVKSDNFPQSITVRLFIIRENIIEDRNAWIEMDKFTVCLTQQQETITRKGVDSAVARKVRPFKSDSRCSCGWPQNLMLPVGTRDGLCYVAFAMLTKGDLGQDDQTHSLSFCGIEDADYPDPRGMGYPFNKKWQNKIDSNASVESIVAGLPHIKLSRFRIYRYTKWQVDAEETKEGDLLVAFNNWMNLLEGKKGD